MKIVDHWVKKIEVTQPSITSLKLKTEKLQKDAKYVQS